MRRIKCDNGHGLIIKNTLILNIRVVVVACVSLITTRMVLAKLGVANFGVFAVIIGYTSMFTIINDALATSTQRHIAYSLGGDRIIDSYKWFSVALFFHIVVGVLFLIFSETVGLYFFMRFLVVPISLRDTSGWLYQAAILSTFMNVLVVPYQALFNAYEEMHVVSLLSIVQSLLQLILAFIIYHIDYDLLLVYGVGYCIIALVMTMLNYVISRLMHEKYRFDYHLLEDVSAVKELVAYAGWSLFGTIAGVFRFEGITVLLNYFFGPVVNTAFYMANQLSMQLSFLSQSLLKAISPKIIKLEGGQNRDKMVKLSNVSSKYSFILLSLISVPVVMEADFILGIWLKSVPELTVLFIRLILIGALIDQLTSGVVVSIQAIGKIALYQAVVGGVLMLNLLLGYILFEMRFPEYSVFVVSVFVYMIAGCFRLVFMRRLSNMKIIVWAKDVLLRVIVTSGIAMIFSVGVMMVMGDGIVRSIALIVIYPLISIIVFYLYGMEDEERIYFNYYWKKFRNKVSIINNYLV